jgi:hypothetical protein
MGDASRYNGLLGMEASLARVFLFGLKTGGACDDGWCTWHHHGGCIRSKLKTDGSM